jgi:sulfite reductase (ferredoxin)
MSESSRTWKQTLGARIPEAWGREIDIFETQMELRKRGKIEEKLFAETRLRRGAYGQRYDNGQRHDGEKAQALVFPAKDATKGPSTMWDAPGMQRIKIPRGPADGGSARTSWPNAPRNTPTASCTSPPARTSSSTSSTSRTRPDMHRRLAAAGITTREACGNTVRNVTACPQAGVCRTEAFDVAPYAHAPDVLPARPRRHAGLRPQIQGRVLGLQDNACGLTNFHDIGAIARTREVNGKTVRGFELVVGGGLGAVPQNAQVFDEFLPEEELLPISQAMSRVFSRLGERANRAKARFKFVVKKIGIEETKRLVLEERAKLRPDPRWTAFLADLHNVDEKPLRPAGKLPAGPHPDGFEAWRENNVLAQRQAGLRDGADHACRSAISRASRPARSRTSRASTRATRCARPPTRTCCCAG